MAVCLAPPHLYSSRVPASLHHSHWFSMAVTKISWFGSLKSHPFVWLQFWKLGAPDRGSEGQLNLTLRKKKSTARKRKENNNSKNHPGISQLLVAPVASWLVKAFFWYLLSWIRLTMSNFSPLQGLTYWSTPSPCSSSHLSICKDSLSI